MDSSIPTIILNTHSNRCVFDPFFWIKTLDQFQPSARTEMVFNDFPIREDLFFQIVAPIARSRWEKTIMPNGAISRINNEMLLIARNDNLSVSWVIPAARSARPQIVNPESLTDECCIWLAIFAYGVIK